MSEIMIFFSNLGEYGFIWILTAVVFLFLKKYRRWGLLMLLALCVTFFIGEVGLKNLINRSRPFLSDTTITLLVPIPLGSSFPSGHTASSFTAAWILFRMNKKVGAAGLFLALCIAFSRMYLQVHYPTDVIAGIALGLLCAEAVYRLYHYLLRKKVLNQ